MTRSDEGRLNAAANGDATTDPASLTRTSDSEQPLSRREAREQEQRLASRRKVSAPSIRSTRQVAATVAPAAAVTLSSPAQRAPKGRPAAKRRGAMHTLMSMGAMLGVAAMLVSTSISGSTFGPGQGAEASAVAGGQGESADVQSLDVVAATSTAAGDVVRDSFTAKAYVPPPVKQAPVRFVAQRPGTSANWSYTNNPSGSVQWPFAQPAPITYGFGPRSACSYCSSYHLGVDFTPGAGVPIQAIADGVVSSVKSDGGFGNYVVVDHVINGQRIQSLYAHMAWGSVQVATGQQISVGTVIGAVGSTGASTGAHLHLEVHADGTPIDPFAWLKANAN